MDGTFLFFTSGICSLDDVLRLRSPRCRRPATSTAHLGSVSLEPGFPIEFRGPRGEARKRRPVASSCQLVESPDRGFHAGSELHDLVSFQSSRPLRFAGTRRDFDSRLPPSQARQNCGQRAKRAFSRQKRPDGAEGDRGRANAIGKPSAYQISQEDRTPAGALPRLRPGRIVGVERRAIPRFPR